MTTKQIDHLSVIRDDLFALKNQIPEKAALILTLIVEVDIGTETQKQVPVSQLPAGGTLRRSWGVDDVIITHGNLSISFGYSVYYGIYVHERIELHHKHPTKAKFLEDPVNEAIDILPERVLDLMDMVLGV